MGGRTKNLTKTPILVLFVILISVGIGTASLTNAQVGTVPDWFRGVAGFWAEEKISTAEFLEGLEFLIDHEVIVVPGYVQAADAQSVDQESLDEIWATINSLQNQIDSIDTEVQANDNLDFADGTNYIQWNEKFKILDTREDLRVGNTMYVGTYTPDDDDAIWMDSGNEYIMWD